MVLAGTVTLTWNALFQRIAKEVGGAVTKFIYDQKRLLAETDEMDQTTRSYTSRTTGTGGEYGGLVNEYDPEELEESWPEYDAQWSTRELIDQDCANAGSLRNTAFGLVSAASNPSLCDMSVAQWDGLPVEGWNVLPVCRSRVFGFGGSVGYYRDSETDLYLMGGGGQGRYYDPAIGRFTTQDPVGVDSDSSANLYLLRAELWSHFWPNCVLRAELWSHFWPNCDCRDLGLPDGVLAELL
jgi:RHS repeat-associated protein